MIIYRNVRSNTTDFPALADTPGVALLAGYSPSLLKVVMDGCEIDESAMPIVDEEKPAKIELNPVDILKKAISDERYNSLSL